MLPAALMFQGSVTSRPPTEAELASASPDPFLWLQPAIAVAIAFYCLWAFWSVIRAWNDPAAKVLRFTSLALLFFDFLIVWNLLQGSTLWST